MTEIDFHSFFLADKNDFLKIFNHDETAETEVTCTYMLGCASNI